MSASVVYDKTVFKPASVTRLGRYGFTLSGDSAAEASDDAEAPAQKSGTDFGDFENLAPADQSPAGEDELPALDGPVLK